MSGHAVVPGPARKIAVVAVVNCSRQGEERQVIDVLTWLQEKINALLQTVGPDQQAALQTGQHFECRGATDTRLQLVAMYTQIAASGCIDVNPIMLINACQEANPDDTR